MKMLAIRRATPCESGQLSAIAVAAKRHWRYPEHWIQAWLPQLTVTPLYIEQHTVFVAVMSDVLRGFYGMSRRASHWELEHLWVLPDVIGQGLGRNLFEHAVRHVTVCGPRVLQFDSDPNADGFYEHMGAKRIGTAPAHMDDVERHLTRFESRIVPDATRTRLIGAGEYV